MSEKNLQPSINQKKFMDSLSETIKVIQNPEIVQEAIKFALELEVAGLPYLKTNPEKATRNRRDFTDFLYVPNFGLISYGSLDCFSTPYILLKKLKATFPNELNELFIDERMQLIQQNSLRYAIENNYFTLINNAQELVQLTPNFGLLLAVKKTEQDDKAGLIKQGVGNRHLYIILKDEDNTYLAHNKNPKEGFVVEKNPPLERLNFDNQNIYLL